MPEVVLADSDFNDGTIDIITMMQKAGLASSRSDARRNIEGGGVSADGTKVTEIGLTFTKEDLANGGIIVKRGKKKFVRIKA